MKKPRSVLYLSDNIAGLSAMDKPLFLRSATNARIEKRAGSVIHIATKVL